MFTALFQPKSRNKTNRQASGEGGCFTRMHTSSGKRVTWNGDAASKSGWGLESGRGAGRASARGPRRLLGEEGGPPCPPTARAGPSERPSTTHHQDAHGWRHQGAWPGAGAPWCSLRDEAPWGRRTLQRDVRLSLRWRGWVERRGAVRRAPLPASVRSPWEPSPAPGFQGASGPLGQAMPSHSDLRVLWLLPLGSGQVAGLSRSQGDRRTGCGHWR